MQRDLPFLSEAIHAAEKFITLGDGATTDSLQATNVPSTPSSGTSRCSAKPAASSARRNWSADLQILLDTVQPDPPLSITELKRALASLS